MRRSGKAACWAPQFRQLAKAPEEPAQSHQSVNESAKPSDVSYCTNCELTTPSTRVDLHPYPEIPYAVHTDLESLETIFPSGKGIEMWMKGGVYRHDIRSSQALIHFRSVSLLFRLVSLVFGGVNVRVFLALVWIAR